MPEQTYHKAELLHPAAACKNQKLTQKLTTVSLLTVSHYRYVLPRNILPQKIIDEKISPKIRQRKNNLSPKPNIEMDQFFPLLFTRKHEHN